MSGKSIWLCLLEHTSKTEYANNVTISIYFKASFGRDIWETRPCALPADNELRAYQVFRRECVRSDLVDFSPARVETHSCEYILILCRPIKTLKLMVGASRHCRHSGVRMQISHHLAAMCAKLTCYALGEVEVATCRCVVHLPFAVPPCRIFRCISQRFGQQTMQHAKYDWHKYGHDDAKTNPFHAFSPNESPKIPDRRQQ